MKQKLLNKLWLRVGMIVAIMTTALSGTAWAETKVLTFDLTSNPGSWPTANSTTLTNYTYTLNSVTYTFALSNVKCNSGYLMMTSTAVLGLPAIEGYKLTKVVASNSSGCSTSTRVGVSSSSSSASYITGGAYQTWSKTGSSYTYNLTSTSANTMYYLYVTNKNAQVTNLELTYESSGGSSAVETTTTIDATGITNTDVHTSTVAGSLSASVTAGGSAVAGATVTWSGNNNSVATIDASTGVVTLVGAGTVTFTASYAGVSGEYQASSDTYEMTVTSSAPDYTTLPFSWEGGASSALLAKAGVTANGLGSDYAASNAPYLVKFDTTGDYIQIKTASQPGKVTIDVKMLGGTNTSSITVQESADGETFTDVQTLSISGNSNTTELTLETTNDFAATTRYVRLLFTKGSNVGVGAISIALPSNDPVISAEDASIAYNTTSGSIEYEIVHPVEGGTISASTDAEWLTFGSTGTAYTAEENTNISARVANVTLTYTYNTSQKVTKEITLTQGGDPNAPGTENNPYTVAEAIAATPSTANVYIRGIVSSFYNTSVVGDGNNYRYYISDDGTNADQLLVYKGKKNSTDNFSDAGDLEIGDVVIIYGGLTTYNNAAEVASGNYIVSRTTKTANNLTKTDDITLNESDLTATANATDYFTTSSTGDISYEIADETVATVNASGVVTPVAAGTTTLTVSQAADATYKAGSLEITVTVAAASLNSTTIVANAGGSTTYGTNKEEEYMISVTYDGTVAAVSSNSSVATVAITQPNVDGEGTFTITPVAVGTAVITISAPATATCEAAGDVTYSITVNAPTGGTTAAESGFVKVTAIEDITDGEYLIVYEDGPLAFDGSLDGLDAVGNTIDVEIANDKIAANSTTTASTFTIAAVTGGYSIQSKSGYYIGQTSNANGLTTSDETVYTNTLSITDGDADIVSSSAYLRYNSASNQTRFRYYKSSSYTGQKAIQLYKLAGADITVTLNGSGYATYCSQYPLDFSDYETADYSAWQITGISGETITFSQITGRVKGGTGILLKGTAGEPITLTSADSEITLSGNKLYGTLAPTYVAADTYYGLSGKEFVKVNAGTVPAGKALLPASALSSSVKAFTFVFEDDATGIEETLSNSPLKGENIYNLAGQMVNGKSVNGKLPKGIYIVAAYAACEIAVRILFLFSNSLNI